MKEPFCVIGANIQTRNGPGVDRTWKSTEKDAIEHARRLIQGGGYNNSNPTELYVVKVVKIVRVAGPPIEVVSPSRIA